MYFPTPSSAEDDGALSFPIEGFICFETIAGSRREVEAYLASYSWVLLNPDFYSLPRRLFLGASFNF